MEKRRLRQKIRTVFVQPYYPKKRRYCTDLISQSIKNIYCAFYTDTLFENHKSIIENTCAQIFTSGDVFVYVHPMQYNSQYGEFLHLVKRDIGVPNTLISDNAGEQIGPKIELQEFIH